MPPLTTRPPYLEACRCGSCNLARSEAAATMQRGEVVVDGGGEGQAPVGSPTSERVTIISCGERFSTGSALRD